MQLNYLINRLYLVSYCIQLLCLLMKSMSNELTSDQFDIILVFYYNNSNQLINFNWGKTFLNCLYCES